jgi:hypothetical protein
LASSIVAFERSTFARAEARLAAAWLTRAWKDEGSRRAITWPFLTRELKSAPSQLMVPDTCDPTWTVITA